MTFLSFVFSGTLIHAKCPPGFIRVGKNLELNVAKSFCVMKYPAKALNQVVQRIRDFGCSTKECNQRNWAKLTEYLPISNAKGVAWRMIDFYQAKKACQSLGEGFHLITNKEWMAIANEIENLSANWTGRKVGVGLLNRGHSDANPGHPCDQSIENVDGNCYRRGGTSGQRRTHFLRSGEKIWDFSGNLWEWVDWQVKFKKLSVLPNKWLEVNQTQLVTEIGHKLSMKCFGSLKHPNWGSDKGFGKYWLGRAKGGSEVLTNGLSAAFTEVGSAALRGGRWSYSERAGIYALDISTSPQYAGRNVTFRCVKR